MDGMLPLYILRPDSFHNNGKRGRALFFLCKICDNGMHEEYFFTKKI